MRCFRHVLLGGGCRADPGYSGEVISLSWLGFPVVSCRHQWSECLLRPHMLQEVNHWAHTADRGHCHSSWERLKMAMINESLQVNPNLVFTTQVTLTHLLKGSQESEHSHHLACPWLWQESHYIQLLQLIAKHLLTFVSPCQISSSNCKDIIRTQKLNISHLSLKNKVTIVFDYLNNWQFIFFQSAH